MSFPDAQGPFHSPACLACGAENPNSMGLRIRAEGGRVLAEVTFDERQAGAPGLVHGGSVAVAFDDVLGTVPLLMGLLAVTANLSVDYRAPIPLGTAAQIIAWPVRHEGRKLFLAGELRAGERLLAEASGLFLEVPPQHFPTGRVI